MEILGWIGAAFLALLIIGAALWSAGVLTIDVEITK